MAENEARPRGRLQGKVAIVTGGATGIGEAIVHKFVREGARVTLAGLPHLHANVYAFLASDAPAARGRARAGALS
jgi:NAD(P)-dependent dehydrogenase (short-subunit alcohol dehydrogenase family)